MPKNDNKNKESNAWQEILNPLQFKDSKIILMYELGGVGNSVDFHKSANQRDNLVCNNFNVKEYRGIQNP